MIRIATVCVCVCVCVIYILAYHFNQHTVLILHN
jgi:hypothetical protein